MLQIYASNKWESKSKQAAGPVIFGREPEPGGDFCVLQDPFVSRSQLKVEELPGGRVRFENLSRTNPAVFADGTRLDTGASLDRSLPVRLTIGQTLIDLAFAEVAAVEPGVLRTISEPVVSHSSGSGRILAALGESTSAETLARWFETVMVVQRAAASSPEFYAQTARAMVELVGLDCGFVLLRRGDGWDVAARHAAGNSEGGGFSQTILRRVAEEKRTYFEDPKTDRPSASLMDVSAVVASPIIDERAGVVVGVLYGVRYRSPTRPSGEIRPIEAQLVQILATIASMGRSRVATEAEATRRSVLFEQFFSKDLSSELERDPGLLDGRDREVTIMFSDIRNFSRLSEPLAPRDTCRLIGDVMERLTARIREHHGVVVDYIGDGLLAMWNAPKEQPDQALLACKAALAMQSELPGLNEDWMGQIGGSLGVGIGINTGMALVGNTGSKQKFKYGPLGHAVNLASRVEGATKHLGVPILVTGSTREKMGGGVPSRRIGKVRVKGIACAVDFFELIDESKFNGIIDQTQAYESALRFYEQGRFADCCQALYPILSGQEGHYDQPSLTLATLAMGCLKSPPMHFDPVFELDQK
jgi:adenylate cyclase